MIDGSIFYINFGKSLSEYEEGSVVFLRENDVPTEFYVAKHEYEKELNNTARALLIRKYVETGKAISSDGLSAWGTCELRNWLNTDYYNYFSDKIQSLIGETKYYYTIGAGDWTVQTRSDSIFLLSMTELGVENFFAPVEGTAIPGFENYFIAYRDDTPVNQWTRSPCKIGNNSMWAIDQNGNTGGSNAAIIKGVRPILTLPESTIVSSNNYIE